jgi:hypothetical protein
MKSVLTPKLKKLVRSAARELATEPLGALTLGNRYRLWVAAGPLFGGGGRAPLDAGLCFRTHLAAAAVRRVLPHWEAVLPADDYPQRLLKAAEQYLAGELSYEKAYDLVGLGWVHASKISAQLADRRAPGGRLTSLVGYAASRVLFVAVQDELFDPDDVDDPESHGSGDPESMDASYMASAVAAGGFPEDKSSDVGARRQYWQWYLEEAVPRAWQAVPGAGTTTRASRKAGTRKSAGRASSDPPV